jgi:hypothetical protein
MSTTATPSAKSIKTLNIIAAVLHGLLGLIVVIWSLSGQVSSAFPSGLGEYEGMGEGRHLIDVPPMFLVQLLATFLLVTCVFHSIYAGMDAKYMASIDKGESFLRFAEYSLTASLMIFIIALSCGVYSLDSQILIVVAIFCCMICGLISETKDLRAGRIATGVGWVLFIAAFGVILRRFFTVADQAPGFVKILIVSMVLFYASFGGIHLFHQIKGKDSVSLNRKVETAYIVDSFVSKTFLVAILFVGLVRREDE